MRYLYFLFFFLLPVMVFSQDWPNLSHYQKDNEEYLQTAGSDRSIVFMGNSITEGWSVLSPDFFAGKPYINRGIGGQTTPQMLIRFRQDVIDLNPSIVVILAGINDIAGNTGPMTIRMTFDNIASMCELAVANDIPYLIFGFLQFYGR